MPADRTWDSFDDAELDARVAWSCAKMRVVADMLGLDIEVLAERMEMMGVDEHFRMNTLIENTPVDPRTGSGLH